MIGLIWADNAPQKMQNVPIYNLTQWRVEDRCHLIRGFFMMWPFCFFVYCPYCTHRLNLKIVEKALEEDRFLREMENACKEERMEKVIEHALALLEIDCKYDGLTEEDCLKRRSYILQFSFITDESIKDFMCNQDSIWYRDQRCYDVF